MAEKLFLELVSPERRVVSQEVDEVIAPGVEGDVGILPEHTPFLTALRTGELVFRVDGHSEYVSVDRGFMEVNENKVIILAESAVLGKEIDLEEAIRRKVAAEKILQEERVNDKLKFQKAEAELMRSLVEISIAEKLKAK